MRDVGTDMNDVTEIEGDEKQPFDERLKGWQGIVALVVVFFLDLFFLSSLTLLVRTNKRLTVIEIVVYSILVFAMVLLAITSWITRHPCLKHGLTHSGQAEKPFLARRNPLYSISR